MFLLFFVLYTLYMIMCFYKYYCFVVSEDDFDQTYDVVPNEDDMHISPGK